MISLPMNLQDTTVQKKGVAFSVYLLADMRIKTGRRQN